jgi:hypothetical protein
VSKRHDTPQLYNSARKLLKFLGSYLKDNFLILVVFRLCFLITVLEIKSNEKIYISIIQYNYLPNE